MCSAHTLDARLPAAQSRGANEIDAAAEGSHFKNTLVGTLTRWSLRQAATSERRSVQDATSSSADGPRLPMDGRRPSRQRRCRRPGRPTGLSITRPTRSRTKSARLPSTTTSSHVSHRSRDAHGCPPVLRAPDRASTLARVHPQTHQMAVSCMIRRKRPVLPIHGQTREKTCPLPHLHTRPLGGQEMCPQVATTALPSF